MAYSIVRPTAFFKSLSGQVERVRRGRPFLVFGDGRLTACKPISDGDLAEYLADCLEDDRLRGRVLPIGGPGEAITPRQQGEALFALLGRAPRFRAVPVALLDGVAGVLGAAGRLVPSLAEKAELARIGRYYATESMLVLDPASGRLRCGGHAVDRERDAVRVLPRAAGRGGRGGARGARRVLRRRPGGAGTGLCVPSDGCGACVTPVPA